MYRMASIAITIAIVAGSAAEMCAQIKPDSIEHTLDLRDVALLMVRAEKVQKAWDWVHQGVQNESPRSRRIFWLAGAIQDTQYRKTYLPPPQGSDSVIAHVVLVEHLGTWPTPYEYIVAFDRQQRPYRLAGFDSSDFGLLISRVFPRSWPGRRARAPEILRLFLELQLNIEPPRYQLVVDTSCLSRSDTVPVHAPQYRFDRDRIDIEFFASACPDPESVLPIPWLLQYRLWENKEGLVEFERVEVWRAGDCWCKGR